jgi:succinoglycan biosynthesis transport protein ExoP
LHSLQDALRGERKQWAGQSILLLGFGKDAQATAVGINLATLAAANKRALLIDADMSSQATATLKCRQSEYGLLNIAAGRISMAEALVHDAKTNIYVLPFVGRHGHGHASTSDEAIKSAFSRTKYFEQVVIAATHDAENPIAPFLAGLADRIVLVARGKVRKRAVADVLAQLGASAAKFCGIVLTNAK